MHTETRTEIIVFSGIAGMVALWWFLSRSQAAAAQSLDSLPVGSTDGSSSFNPQDSLSTPTGLSPVAAGVNTFNIGGPGGLSVGGSNLLLGGAGGGGGCGCDTCASGGTGLTFGTPTNLADYLSVNPSLIPTAEQLSSWA